MNNLPDEGTNEPLLADDRNYYKVEKWTKDGAKVDRIALRRQQSRQGAGDLHGGNRPRIRLTIRQRTRVLEQWPE
jgi:hypothetical protein